MKADREGLGGALRLDLARGYVMPKFHQLETSKRSLLGLGRVPIQADIFNFLNKENGKESSNFLGL